MSPGRAGALRIMKKTYTGTCHCKAIEFACDVDLDAGTTRCNCSFCAKARTWFAIVPAADVRLIRGGDALADYQHTPAGKTEPFLHFHFCRVCGVRPFAKGGHLPALGGEFYAVYIAALDLPEAALAAIPIRYADGRHDAWDRTPAHHAYL
jgi:hypothetical protein